MNKFNKPNRGFTLLEILVVIAIIGILSGIVLAFLGGARSSSADARIRSNLNSVFKEANLYFNSNDLGNGFYKSSPTSPTPLGNCGVSALDGTALSDFSSTSGTSIRSRTLIDDAVTASGVDINDTRCRIFGTSDATNPGGYIVVVPLRSSGFWCVDNLGNSRKISAQIGLATRVCPTS